MVFFPGGGFQSGWIGTAMHNGSSLASNHGIIVVSANYRLGGRSHGRECLLAVANHS